MDNQEFSVGISRNSFLQINAIIIAGLLILLTVQSVATDSLFELSYTSKLLLAEQKILQEWQKELYEAKSMYENRDEEGNIILETNPTGKEGEIQFSIPLPLPLLEEQELRIEKLDEENFYNRVKLQAKIDAYEQLPWLSKLFTNPQLIVAITILPFLVSTTSELVNWIVNKTKKEPRIVSVVFFIIGLVVMGLIFAISLIAHINT